MEYGTTAHKVQGTRHMKSREYCFSNVKKKKIVYYNAIDVFCMMLTTGVQMHLFHLHCKLFESGSHTHDRTRTGSLQFIVRRKNGTKN